MSIGFHPVMNDGGVPASEPGWNFAQHGYGSTTPLPPTLQSTGSVSKPSSPVYNGGSIGNVHQVASALGVSSNYDPESGMVFVNQRGIKPTSMVNGEPHAPVRQVAQAAGYPSTHIQATAQGVQVMPRQTAQQPMLQNGAQGNAVMQLQKMLGIPADGIFGPQTQQAVRNFQIQNHLQVDGIVGPQTWAALQNYHGGGTQQQAQPQQTTQQPAQQQQMDPVTQLMALSTLGAPQAPQAVQLPTLDASGLQPFQWDQNQAVTNAFNALDPTYQQQMATDDQKMMEQQNSRGIFNSGVGQQMVDEYNQGLRGQEYNAAMKQADSNRAEAFKEYQGNIDNVFKAYQQNLDAAYKQGQLDDSQYKTATDIWKTQVDMAKAALPYETMTKYQEAQVAISAQKEQFAEWAKIQDIQTARDKIAAAQQNAALNAALKQEGINLQSRKLTDDEKNAAIDQAIKQQQMQNSQLNDSAKTLDTTIKSITAQMATMRTNGVSETDPKYVQLANEVQAYTDQLANIADAQQMNGADYNSTHSYAPPKGTIYAN